MCVWEGGGGGGGWGWWGVGVGVGGGGLSHQYRRAADHTHQQLTRSFCPSVPCLPYPLKTKDSLLPAIPAKD